LRGGRHRFVGLCANSCGGCLLSKIFYPSCCQHASSYSKRLCLIASCFMNAQSFVCDVAGLLLAVTCLLLPWPSSRPGHGLVTAFASASPVRLCFASASPLLAPLKTAATSTNSAALRRSCISGSRYCAAAVQPEGKEGGNSACFGRYDRSVAFSCLLLIPSAIESAYNDTKVHVVSEKLKCGPIAHLMS
jgi:hypothetical protein